MLDSNQRQLLLAEMKARAVDTFIDMGPAEVNDWFVSMDETAVLTFDLPVGSDPLEAEQRHALHLLAMALAIQDKFGKQHHICNNLLSLVELSHRKVPVYP